MFTLYQVCHYVTYTIRRTVYTIQCTLYTVQCILYIIRRLYIYHTQYTVYYTADFIFFTMLIVQCTSYSVYNTMYVVEYTPYNVRHTMLAILMPQLMIINNNYHIYCLELRLNYRLQVNVLFTCSLVNTQGLISKPSPAPEVGDGFLNIH